MISRKRKIFNVGAYWGSNEFTITLLEGIVNIYTNGGERPLTRLGVNEVFISRDGKFRKERFTDFDYPRWKDGLYCFGDTPFNLLLGKLEKYYMKIIRSLIP
jgi:ferric-dicitrate binding protein FerR (iron transport regulator)